MSDKNILISDRFAQEALLTLQNQTFLKIKKSATTDLTHADLSEVHGLIIRSATQITEDILKKAKHLQVIVTSTSGFDHIDLRAVEKWGITVMNTPDAHIESAAQLTWGLVLSSCYQLNQAHKSVQQGHWRHHFPMGLELHKKTYGIMGLGRIGSRVAEIAHVFGMHVIAYDPYIEDSDFKNASVERVSFEEVLKRSDVLSLHVPSTQETHRLLHRVHFDFINPGCILINTARGNLISEDDLCYALDKKRISAAGLDVFEKEPLSKSSRLIQYPQVILTPHMGAYTQDAFLKASEQAALKILRFFMDGSTSDTLPPKAAWYTAQVHQVHNNS